LGPSGPARKPELRSTLAYEPSPPRLTLTASGNETCGLLLRCIRAWEKDWPPEINGSRAPADRHFWNCYRKLPSPRRLTTQNSCNGQERNDAQHRFDGYERRHSTASKSRGQCAGAICEFGRQPVRWDQRLSGRAGPPYRVEPSRHNLDISSTRDCWLSRERLARLAGNCRAALLKLPTRLIPRLITGL